MFLMNRRQISSIIIRILNTYQVKKQGVASIREGASIRINTVFGLYKRGESEGGGSRGGGPEVVDLEELQVHH